MVDGDTIDVVVNGVEMRVRYIGMDTPEVHSGVEWLGPESSAANSALVAGKEVVLEKDVSETDQYGRALRYVWVHEDSGWLLVNLELIRQGFASVTTYPPDVKYVDALYLAAQADAQTGGPWAMGSRADSRSDNGAGGCSNGCADPADRGTAVELRPLISGNLHCGRVG